MTKKNDTYTLSKLQMYSDCPQKYKLCYLDKVHVLEKLSAAKTGNNLHSIIDAYLKGNDVTKLVEALSMPEKHLWYNFKNSEIKNFKFIVSEYPFNVRFDEFWLTGRIDALFHYDGKFIVADWKTGENFKSDNVKFQTSFYLLCMFEIIKAKGLIKDPKDLNLIYFNLAHDNNVRINFNEDLYLQYKAQILNLINKISTNIVYPCNKTDKCKSCKYYSACPFI